MQTVAFPFPVDASVRPMVAIDVNCTDWLSKVRCISARSKVICVVEDVG